MKKFLIDQFEEHPGTSLILLAFIIAAMFHPYNVLVGFPLYAISSFGGMFTVGFMIFYFWMWRYMEAN